MDYYKISEEKKVKIVDYTFETISRYDLCSQTSKIISLIDRYSGEEMTLVFGQILTAFSEPMFIRESISEAYVYCIIATDTNGKQFVLTVYHGQSGPSIGGKKENEGAYDAALALKKYIREQDATDFEYIGYGFRGTIKVVMKIKDGKASWSEYKVNGERPADDLGILRILPHATEKRLVLSKGNC